jgi:hypothetical protein
MGLKMLLETRVNFYVEMAGFADFPVNSKKMPVFCDFDGNRPILL